MMLELKLEAGQIVFSKAGHDKGDIFVVLKSDDKYAYLADGKRRKLAKPKKKKLIHIQKTNKVAKDIIEKLDSGILLDSDLRKTLKCVDN